jgi:hypothetical protein
MGESDTVGVTLGVTEVLDVTDSVGVREAVMDLDCVREGVIDLLSVVDGVAEGDSVPEAVTDALSEAVAESDGDFVTEMLLVEDRDGVRDEVGLREGERDTLALRDADTDIDDGIEVVADPDDEAVSESDTVLDTEAVGLPTNDDNPDGDAE